MEDQTDASRPSIPSRISLKLEEVAKIAYDLYELHVVNIKELNGYDDKNYFISDGNENNGFILKIINSIDSQKPDIFQTQSLLLLHLDKQGINCPTPIKTKNGNYFEKYDLSSGKHVIRLLKYIDGLLLTEVACTSKLLYEIGQTAAYLDNTLKSFQRSTDQLTNFHSLWMLNSVPQIHQFLGAVKDENKRRLVETVVKEFAETVLPLEEKLEKGLIHGDVNEQNIIVENKDGVYKIKAIIDFGDCHIGCYLYELAISMAYMIIFTKDVKAAGYVLAGYTSVRPIDDVAYSLLKVCIAARICQSVVIGTYTSQQDPENSYILTTAKYGWLLLEKIWNQSTEELLVLWKSCVKLPDDSNSL